MGVINRNTILALNRAYETIFNTALESAPPSPFFSEAVMEVPSSGRENNYAWMLRPVAMREWIGEREVLPAVAEEWRVLNRTYEATIETKIADIEDGTYALSARTEVQMLADAYRRKLEEGVIDLLFTSFGGDDLTVGTKHKGIDGVPFFADNHPHYTLERRRKGGTETYEFKKDGTYSNVTDAAFSRDALRDARTAMRKLKDIYGRPANVTPNILVVGPDLEFEALEVIGATAQEVEIAPGVRLMAPNPLGGQYRVIVLNELGDSPAWFLFDTSRPIKPILFQNRVAPQMQMLSASRSAEGEVDHYVFMNDAILHGVRARFGMAMTLPWLGYASTGTA